MNERDSLPIGILLGAVTPVLGYILIDFVVKILIKNGIIAALSGSVYDSRMRTILLIAIVCNLLPFNIAKNKRWDRTMRGIVFPTLVYVGYWMYMYAGSLMQS